MVTTPEDLRPPADEPLDDPVDGDLATDEAATDDQPDIASLDDGGDDGGTLKPAAPGPVQRSNRRFWLLLLLPLVVGCLVRVTFGFTDDVPTNDATAYLRSGYSILDGDGFRREGSPELHFPPGAPVILAATSNVFDDPLTGLVVATAAFGTALLVPLALLGRRIGGERGGLFVAWVGALCPALAALVVNAGGGSENPYLFFMLSALLAVLNAADAPTRRRRALFAALGGLFTGLAYLTRPEAFGFVAIFLPLLVLGAIGGWRVLLPSALGRSGRARKQRPGGIKEAALLSGAFLMALLVCMGPYLSYLHSNTGRWEVTAKSRDASIEAWRAVAEHDRRERDAVLYELDDTGFQFVAGRETLPTLAREDPSGYFGIVKVNVGNFYSELVWWEDEWWPTWALIPPVLTAVAVWAAWKHRRDRAVWGVLGLFAICTATALAFFVQPRYLIPATAMICVLGGVGLSMLKGWWKWTLVPLSMALMVTSLIGAAHGPTGYLAPREPVEHRLVGEWLNENTDPTDRVMTRSMVVGFYADRRTVAMPYSSLPEMIDFARHHGVKYIVADEYQLDSLRPQFYPLFGFEVPDELEFVDQIVVDGRVTRIFQLDPPPKRGTPDAPGVGFVGDQG
jgi:hypothetical protein